MSVTYTPECRVSADSTTFRVLDQSGNPILIAGTATGDDVQAITAPTTIATSGSTTFSFGGYTTTSIDYTIATQPSYGQWSFPITPGVPHDLWSSAPAGVSFQCTDVLVEVIESGEVTLEAHFSQSNIGSSGTYQVVHCTANGADTDVTFVPIVLGYTPTTSTLTVRFSMSYAESLQGDNHLVCDCICVVPAGGNPDQTSPAPAFHDDYATSPDTFTGANFGWNYGGNSAAGYWGGNGRGFYAGGVSVLDIDAPTVQSALQALPSIGAGNVEVSYSSAPNPGSIYNAGSLTIEFVGAMGQEAQPTITLSSADLAVAHTVGGNVPSLTRTPQGGTAQSPITLKGPQVHTASSTTFPFAPATPLAGLTFAQTDSVLATIPANWVALSTVSDVQRIAFDPGVSGGTFTLSGTNPLTSATFTTAPIAFTKAITKNGSGVITASMDLSIQAAIVAACGNAAGIVSVSSLQMTWSGPAANMPVATMTIDATSLVGGSATIKRDRAGCAGGYLPAQSVAALNRVGRDVSDPIPSGPRKMGVLYNIGADTYSSEILIFRNMLARAGLPYGNAAAIDQSTGVPTLLNSYSIQYFCSVPNADSYVPGGKGAMLCPPGRYTGRWIGPAGAMTIGAGGHNTNYTIISQYAANGYQYLIVDCQPDGTYLSPAIVVNFNATGPADANGHYPWAVTEPAIFRPNIEADPTGQTAMTDPTDKFDPLFLNMVRGVQGFRLMDAMAAADNQFADLDQIKPNGWVDRSSAGTVAIQVATLRQYTGSALDNSHRLCLQLTTASPHGLFPGAFLQWPFVGQPTIQLSAAIDFYGTMTSAISMNGFLGVVDVLDDYNLVLHAGSLGKNADGSYVTGITMTNVVTAGNPSAVVGTPWSLQDIVDLCNELRPYGLEYCWCNTSASVSDACATSMAEFYAANLDAGIKVVPELADECWNTYFQSYEYMRIRTFQLAGDPGDSSTAGQAYHQTRVNTLFQAAFTAAGRPDDVVWCMGSMAADPAQTTAILSACAALSGGPARVDWVHAAPYYKNADLASASLGNSLSAAQCADVLQMYTGDPAFNASNLLSHRLKIDAAQSADGTSLPYINTPLAIYEASPEMGIPGCDQSGGSPDTTNYPNLYILQNAVKYHPGSYQAHLLNLQASEDLGVRVYAHYSLSGTFDPTYTNWSAANSYNMAPGTGSWSTDAANIATPTRLDGTVKSEILGANLHYASLNASAPATPAVTPSTLSLAIGGTATLVASNFSGPVTWSSSAPSVATVGASTGLVTGVSPGSATITATDGTHSATCAVTVTAPVIPSATVRFRFRAR